MPRVGYNVSIMSLAVSKSNSLRTTMPLHIAQKMGLGAGDKITWDLDKVKNTWIATVQKKEK